MTGQNFNSLKATLTALDQKILNLESVEADHADIDELMHERAKVQWAIVSAIDNNS